eukprot:scaffold562148_cov14-Prasinocladus_malaysianus.AAC.1
MQLFEDFQPMYSAMLAVDYMYHEDNQSSAVASDIVAVYDATQVNGICASSRSCCESNKMIQNRQLLKIGGRFRRSLAFF